MSPSDESKIRQYIADGTEWKFYKWRAWKDLRREILEQNKNECVECKKRGKYSRATTVHHRFELKQYPQYALSRTVVIDGETMINLVPLCHRCHDDAHERFTTGYRDIKPKGFFNSERW